MKFFPLSLLFTAALLRAQVSVQPSLLDACDKIDDWKTFRSAGVEVTRRGDGGIHGAALRFDVSFTKGSGYGGVYRNFNVPLPDNYEITFWMRATVPVNNFEIKVSNDSSGQDIWWVNNKNYTYPREWKKITVKKRHLAFAWGPHPTAKLDTLMRLELVVTAGTGGSGSVWVGDIELVPLPPPPVKIPTPAVTASSMKRKADAPSNVLPGNKGAWESKTAGEEWIEIDYKYRREIGGVRLSWDPGLSGLSYDLLGSVDGKTYDTLHSVREGKGGAVLIFTPEFEVRQLRIAMHGNQSHTPFRLEGVSVVPSESLSTANQYIEHLAADAPRGWYPRYFLKEASYWTIVGVASDPKEALLNEDGSFEVDKQQFSVEPIITLESGNQLLTWANARSEQTLEEGYLPIPTVTRMYNGVKLAVTLLAMGEVDHSALLARYVLKNTSTQRLRGEFYLAMRPFQVNPTYQWLNFEGGFARTESISIDENRAIIGTKSVTVSGHPANAGATTIDGGEIIEHIARGRLPGSTRIFDPHAMASGAFSFPFDLAPGDSSVLIAAVPFTPSADRWQNSAPTSEEFERVKAEVHSGWEQKLNTVRFNLPPDGQRYADIIRSNLAYVLINKDGPGFQPGSRSYERSWIRDGSMTSAALLKLGLRAEVKNFIDWYSSYQYENGMVPCVVDQRGPDPVPENDSHGELIFACMEYFRFTADTAFLRTHWNNIVAAAEYIQRLRAEQMTSEFRDGDDGKRACYGLVTESISHEGYSAKPMHSYWDDFFALKGLKDAAEAAKVLHDVRTSRFYDSVSHAFREDIYRSISFVMAAKKIDYVPGCAELGDFDPTSTSIALFPCGEIEHVPQPTFNRTFDKYYEWFSQRAAGSLEWDAFTPYEIRNVGTFVYLGQKDRAHTLLEWFLKYQRPLGWNQWAEVVWRDERLPRFIGDMPHTWVGSDYINAVRAMFVYENDESLVVGAGLKDDWVLHGLSVENLPVHSGTLSYSIARSGSSDITVRLQGSVDGMRILIPTGLLSRPLVSAKVDGVVAQPVGKFITVSHLPATVELVY
jgi:hypothetical protein